MNAATTPSQRPRDAKLLVVDAAGRITHTARAGLPDVLKPGDLLIANDGKIHPVKEHVCGIPRHLRYLNGPAQHVADSHNA